MSVMHPVAAGGVDERGQELGRDLAVVEGGGQLALTVKYPRGRRPGQRQAEKRRSAQVTVGAPAAVRLREDLDVVAGLDAVAREPVGAVLTVVPDGDKRERHIRVVLNDLVPAALQDSARVTAPRRPQVDNVNARLCDDGLDGPLRLCLVVLEVKGPRFLEKDGSYDLDGTFELCAGTGRGR